MARPRGYATWNPKPATLDLIAQVEQVLEEYKNHLPLTVRQIFYRLVGQYGYDKTELAYNRLCEHLVRARRAQMIPFSSIRDDGTIERVPLTYDDVDAFWNRVKNMKERYNRDRLKGQPYNIELWCEAAGMVPQLQRVAFPYSVPVYSTGGFSSVTVTHEIAERAMEEGKPTYFLHVGDFDPSGQSIFDAMSEDARTFVLQYRLGELRKEMNEAEGGELERLEREYEQTRKRRPPPEGPDLLAVRVALTEDQVHEHDLPTAPPKKSDTRSRNWYTDTCQAEAMPPDLLAQIVREAIRDRLDLARYEEECDLEEADEEKIEEVLSAV